MNNNNTNDISLTNNNYSKIISEYINNLTKELDAIFNNQIISENDKNIKNKLISLTKESMNTLLNEFNKLQKEKNAVNKKFEKYKKSGEIKKKFLENQTREVYKKLNSKEKIIKNLNKEIEELKNKNNNEIELNNLKNEKNELNYNFQILEKKHKKLKIEISELKELNIKYEERISDLEKENSEINELLIEGRNEIKNNNIKYKSKLEQMQNEIINLNNELDEREQDFQEYKNKYEKELKKNLKLEQKINELIIKEEEENDYYITEYDTKKNKIPTTINSARNRETNNDIEKIEKKFRYLYRNKENLSARNHSKNSHNSTLSNNDTKSRNNKINDMSNNSNNTNDDKKIMYRNNTLSGFKHLLNLYKGKNKNDENNNFTEDKDDNNNSTNLNSNTNTNNYIQENSGIKLTPENYSFINLYQLNNKLKWCLFKKNKTKIRRHSRQYSIGNNELIMSQNSEFDECNYSDFIWIPYKTSKDFQEFRELSSFIDSYDLKSDKKDEINELKINIKNLEDTIYEQKKENEQLNKALENLISENKYYKNVNQKLNEENYYINNKLQKVKSEQKNDKNFIGVSFIADDPESSKFLDDKCCEDILIGLDKNANNKNNISKNISESSNLKYCIDTLISNNLPKENMKNLMASILSQLGCSKEDIIKLIGNHRGVIQIPRFGNK